jgi:hypothetical protein
LAANEWFARLQTITVRTNLISTLLINGGATWKYNDSGQDLGTSWRQSDYDDSSWSNGIARLGYGDLVSATKVSFGPNPTNKYITTYFRRPFVVPQNVLITNLNVRVAQSDGTIVYLNGREIYRTNLAAGPIAYDRTALVGLSLQYYQRYTALGTNVVVSLPAGTNWIAAEVHLSPSTAFSTNSVAMGFDMELIGTGYYPGPLSIALAANNQVTVGWPLTNWGSFLLYSTTNLGATNSWSLVTDPSYTNGDQITVTQAIDSRAKFFRLQLP